MIGIQIDEEKLLVSLSGQIENLFKQLLAVQKPDELLTKERLAGEVFHCAPKTLTDHILCNDDFPFIEIGENRKYSRLAVEDWIRRRQLTESGMYQWEEFKKKGARNK
ncbi:hypothetical protein HCA63_06435 [Listeria booriae]|uniref:hypothetical protein n=1 Tax=Listeria booriae TaxID=1552123 RepID=UPI0016286A5C|nr:hypothetical protein [Listeria booriae]MBC1887987.1 hypothetical protein [Listeria booriae]